MHAELPRLTTTMEAEPEDGVTEATTTYPVEHLDWTVTSNAVALADVIRLFVKVMVSLVLDPSVDVDDVISPA